MSRWSILNEMGDTRSRLPPTAVRRRDCCIFALRGSIALFSEVPKGHTRLRVLCSGANVAGRALRSTLLRWRHSLAERAPSFFPLVRLCHTYTAQPCMRQAQQNLLAPGSLSTQTIRAPVNPCPPLLRSVCVRGVHKGCRGALAPCVCIFPVAAEIV